MPQDGDGPGRNKDDSGQFITDPRTADRGAYVDQGIFLYCKGRQNKTVE